jgi:hypothetical protein
VRPCLAAQFGVATAPSVAAVYNWRNDVRGAIIPDEPALAGNARHWMAYSASYDDTTGRGLHSFRFQLNFSSSVHRVTQLNS